MKNRLRIKFSLIFGLIIMMLAFANEAKAAGTTYIWVGTTSDWTVTTNWSPNGTPTSEEGVSIPVVTSPKVYPTIITGQTVSAKDLTIASGATVNMTGGTFNFYHDWKNSGTFNGTGGTVVFAGKNGGGAWPSSTAVDRFYNVTINTGITEAIDKAGTITVAGTWTNNGTATITNSTIEFNGSDAQTIGGSSTTTFYNAKISSTGGVTLNRNAVTTGTFSVETNGTLNCGGYTVSDAGTFNLKSGGTLGIGSIDGISSSGATGNIQTTTRIFNTGANYIYNGTAAQITGTGLPATVNNLTFSGSGTKTLTGSTAVTGTLTQNDLTVAVGNNTLTANGTHNAGAGVVSGAGGYTLGSGASFTTTHASGVNGNITVTGTKTFNTNNNFTFNGSAAQVTGTLMPATINNLTINNTAGVTASQSITAAAVDNGGTSNAASVLDMSGYALSGITDNTGATVKFSGATNGLAIPTGTAEYYGSTAQTVKDGTYSTLKISNTTGASINAATTADNLYIASGGILNVNAGKPLTVSTALTNAGTLNLLSDATGTATILTNGTVSAGTYNVKQYLSGKTGPSTRANWYLSSPVSEATTGVFDVASLINKITYYDETVPAYVPQITNNTTSLVPGRGYVTYIGGADAVYTFTGGKLNTGDVTLSPTRTGTEAAKRGFNLVGNPYPSYLNWQAAYEATANPQSNMRNAIWYRTYSGGAMVFHTYADGDGVPEVTTGWIPPMQGFWVKVNSDGSNGSITFKNAYRSHAIDGTTFPLKVKAITEKQRLRLLVSNGVNTDETLIVGKSYANAAYDQYDAEKMSNNNVNIPELYSLVDNQELVINSVDQLTDGKNVTLGLRPGKTGTFSIRATQMENIDTKVMLLDKVAGTEQELTAESPYTFEVTDAAATNDRFVISFVAKVPTGFENNNASTDLTVYSNINNKIRVIYRGELNDQTTVAVYNVAGQKLSSQKLTKAATEFTESFNPGVYMIRLNNGNQTITQKLIIK